MTNYHFNSGVRNEKCSDTCQPTYVLHYYFLLTWPLPRSMPKVISELFHALVVDFISTIIIIADVWNYFTDEIYITSVCMLL